MGAARFRAETGIKSLDWMGKFWARWGDALVEAGFKLSLYGALLNCASRCSISFSSTPCLAGDKADGVNGKDAGQNAKKPGEESNKNSSSNGDSGEDGRTVTSLDDVPLEELLRRKRLAEEESSKNMTQYQNKLSGVFV